MEQKPLSPALADAIYDLLVEIAKSPESERARFVSYFTGEQGEVFHEYRIGGLLGWGGKFKYFGIENMYVDYYQETHTVEKEEIRKEINEILQAFKREE